MLIEGDGWDNAVNLEGSREEFAEYVRCLRALPEDDRDKVSADDLADEIQRECVDRDGGECVVKDGDFDALTAALERAEHADAQRVIAAVAEAEAGVDEDDA